MNDRREKRGPTAVVPLRSRAQQFPLPRCSRAHTHDWGLHRLGLDPAHASSFDGRNAPRLAGENVPRFATPQQHERPVTAPDLCCSLRSISGASAPSFSNDITADRDQFGPPALTRGCGACNAASECTASVEGSIHTWPAGPQPSIASLRGSSTSSVFLPPPMAPAIRDPGRASHCFNNSFQRSGAGSTISRCPMPLRSFLQQTSLHDRAPDKRLPPPQPQWQRRQQRRRSRPPRRERGVMGGDNQPGLQHRPPFTGSSSRAKRFDAPVCFGTTLRAGAGEEPVQMSTCAADYNFNS